MVCQWRAAGRAAGRPARPAAIPPARANRGTPCLEPRNFDVLRARPRVATRAHPGPWANPRTTHVGDPQSRDGAQPSREVPLFLVGVRFGWPLFDAVVFLAAALDAVGVALLTFALATALVFAATSDGGALGGGAALVTAPIAAFFGFCATSFVARSAVKAVPVLNASSCLFARRRSCAFPFSLWSQVAPCSLHPGLTRRQGADRSGDCWPVGTMTGLGEESS